MCINNINLLKKEPVRLVFIAILISGRGREIRTPDPLVPNQMRYQTALCPESNSLYTADYPWNQ